MEELNVEIEMNFEIVPEKKYLADLKLGTTHVSGKLPDGIIREDHLEIACPDGKFPLCVDLYYREKFPAKPRPCIIFMHDWAKGENPDLCGDIYGAFFALNGFLFASLYYRPPKYQICPAALEDLKTCARWARANAETYSIGQEMIVALGSSAGSQWIQMAAITNGSAEFDIDCGYNGFSSNIDMVLGNASICDPVRDFKEFENAWITMGGTYREIPGDYHKYSPYHNIHPGMPPFCLIHGTEDIACSIEGARALRDKMLECGNEIELVELPGRDHGCTRHPGDFFDKLHIWNNFICKHLGFSDESIHPV